MKSIYAVPIGTRIQVTNASTQPSCSHINRNELRGNCVGDVGIVSGDKSRIRYVKWEKTNSTCTGMLKNHQCADVFEFMRLDSPVCTTLECQHYDERPRSKCRKVNDAKRCPLGKK